MLGKMEQGVDYAHVLKEAQELGYAEVCESFTLNVSV
jgi:homoserine dehydrogenase